MRVVVLLEVVHVRQQHGKRAPQAPRPLHLVGERAHQVPPVVQPGEPVGDGEALQLSLGFPLPHAHDHVVEHPHQFADFTAGAGRQLDRQIARGHLARGAREAPERAYHEQTHTARHQADTDEQGGEDQARAVPGLATRAHGGRSR